MGVMNSSKILYWTIAISAVILIGAFIWGKKLVSPQPTVNIEEIRKEILEEGKDIRGVIKDAYERNGGWVIVADASVADLSRLDSQETIPKITKTITIIVGPQISLQGKQIPKIGDIVAATLNGNVYEGDRFDAVTIASYTYESETKKQVTEVDRIYGKITSLRGNTFVVHASVADVKKIGIIDFSKSFVVPQVDKDYTVTIASTTQFLNGANKDLKTGAIVLVWGSDLLHTNSFTADRLFIEQ